MLDKALRRILTQRVQLGSQWRRLQLISCGVKIHASCRVSPCVSANLGFSNESDGEIQLNEQVTIDHGVILDAWGGKIILHKSVFIGPHTAIYGHGGVEIGQDALISMHCRILSSNHTIPDRSRHIRWEPDILLPTTIGKDVWLGAGVTVLGGVSIGDGCVVGAGAVVTHDLPPYSVAVGVPAKVVKMRSPTEAITPQELQNTVQHP